MSSAEVEKKRLRKALRAKRRALSPVEKSRADEAIFQRLIAHPAYQNASLVLAYAATPEEISTRALLQHALAHGKRVALPYCVPGTHTMEFYEVTTPLVLRRSAFGIEEPVPEEKTRIREPGHALCVVPALSVDLRGTRLGYGGGFYDRFLAAHPSLQTIALCYDACRQTALPVDKYDIPIQQIITELTMEVYNAG